MEGPFGVKLLIRHRKNKASSCSQPSEETSVQTQTQAALKLVSCLSGACGVVTVLV